MAIDTYVWDGSTDGDTTTAANWTPSGPPDDGDTVIFPAWATQAVDGNADFPASSASGVGFARVTIEEGVTYDIGSRATPLELWMDKDANTGVHIGGTGEYHLSPKDYEEIVITEAGSAPATGRYAVNITGALLDGTTTGAVRIYCEDNQSIGIGAEADSIGEVDELYVYGGDVTVGSGVTLNDASAAFPVVMTGGTLVTNSPFTTATQSGGTWTHKTGAVTTLVVNSGTCYYHSSGTATTSTVGDGGTLDFSQDSTARTLTTCEMYKGATLLDPNKTVTFTAAIDLNQCGLDDVELDLGENIRLTRGSVA